MKILADENVDFPIIHLLRDHGFDVSAVAEDDFGIIDENVLAKAVRINAVLLTADKDFGELRYKFGLPHRGVVFYRLEGYKPPEKATLILDLFQKQMTNLVDAFTVLTARKVRIIRGGQ
ncbi:DUF5615 family PIN-like protein [Spirosoma montaniterrae]|uniref:DUF5615 domain-containing protein n=1 Tax=Spirosoma montaniterrae TaxID=1178516 RepID=A0A1P9WXS4_9BACT|nr:DUF5615 family PIN-like protein [Spirosoma montaniterrae]AQG80175.1 hypothetical protein AWR27_13110 [Spirosoma montaniterrae]